MTGDVGGMPGVEPSTTGSLISAIANSLDRTI